MPHLIGPTASLHSAWLEAHDEWGPGAHEVGFGLQPSDDVRTSAGFDEWVSRLTDDAATVKCTYRWIVEDGKVLGGIALRHGSDEEVRHTGHVGYGIRPSARRQGLATWALGQILNEARRLGAHRVLVICATDNTPSALTIERNGGVFEGLEATEHGPVSRYWIDV